ncbi:hypothetical protein MNEG_5546 [Monoraphidium neglectum]|uniref:Uncharacterized protein n=1 Tax=Monoraphidium neglectum TaxID=145388 RepID=A0A0D2L5Y5_9CHLO|nr:hypothetical protein MNEG_5546 [Monoraphidium neglectum]KIZ02414.1 hypothetical protein MNEG_5546 [Monoraphidium neglectum]|eukprot:XP_013901433.1 hypothetical protein MNEG_5546 [Monoraphidium neglectum]
MITAVNRPAVRTVRAAAPGAGTAAVRFGARRVVRVQASPDPPKSAASENAGERVVKDISDSRVPTSAQDVGPALFEAQPHMASHYKAPNWLPAFTRRREIFAGRLAILGFAAACAFEVLTPDHLGPMGLTSALTGWSIPTVQLLYTAFVGHGLLALTWPGSPTFADANIQDYMKCVG